jgi:hypothetical protein
MSCRMNMRTTYKTLDFLKTKGIDAYDIEGVELDSRTASLDIVYLPRLGGLLEPYELFGQGAITGFLEYLAGGDA